MGQPCHFAALVFRPASSTYKADAESVGQPHHFAAPVFRPADVRIPPIYVFFVFYVVLYVLSCDVVRCTCTFVVHLV